MKKQTKKFVFVLTFVLVITFFLSFAYHLFVKQNSDDARINAAISALSNMVRNNGHIAYKIDLIKNQELNEQNLVREMGSAYALAFAYNQTKEENLKIQLIQILKRARSECVIITDQSCMVDPYKIGATALALLTELYFEKTTSDMQFADIREKWLNILLRSYVPGKGVLVHPLSGQTSPYFNGETWFALSVYHSLYPSDAKASETLQSMDQTMINMYHNTCLVSFVHWGLMAAAQRYETSKDAKFLNFLKNQFDLYLLANPSPRPGSSTCAATEGLADMAYYVSKDDILLASSVLKRIQINKQTIDSLQITNTQNSRDQIHPNALHYIGAFKNTPTDNQFIRSDTTQHCLTALLKSRRATKKFKEYQNK